MRVLVTGAAGQLGGAIVRRYTRRAEVVALTRQQLDIADEAAALEAVRAARPDVIVNCAANNDVEGLEDDAQAAFRTNAFGVLSLARAAAETSATLVHYSTDFVFDGESDRPYVEEDAPRPLSVYALSKLLGEWFAADAPVRYILRVESLFGGERAKSSVDRIIDSLSKGEPTRAFADRTVTPSYVEDVVRATEVLLDRRAEPGLYHCVNSGTTTWLGIAHEAARLLQSSAPIVPVSVDQVQLRARRPRYCALSNAKLARAGIEMPSWQDALARHLATRKTPGQASRTIPAT